MSIDVRILNSLRSSGNMGVSGAELAQQLGVSRAAVWAHIEQLRTLGYEIEASPHRGYRLLSAPDVLHADDLLSRLGQTSVIGRDIRVFEETTSTNDVVERLARDGVKEGVVVFAESQSRGRGRLGRKWVSPPRQGLWFSVLLRPDLRPQSATRMMVASATALRRAIALQTGLQPQIKWPNDILLQGKKTAGILTELSAELDRVKYVVLGIGVDVNLDPADLPPELRRNTTSLKAELERPVSRAELAVGILRELDRDYARMSSGQFAEVADEWEANCATLGQQVTVELGGRMLRGRAESLSEDGALLLRTEHGRLERVVGGDIRLEKGVTAG